jgi:hypothetical protein
MIRNGARDRKGKFIPEMGLSKSESFGLEFLQGSLNKLGDHCTSNIGMVA